MRALVTSLIVLLLVGCSKNNQTPSIASPTKPPSNPLSSPTQNQSIETISFEQRISLDTKALNIIKGADDPTWDSEYVFKNYVFKSAEGFSNFQNFLLGNDFKALPLIGQIRLVWKYLEQAEERNLLVSDQIQTINALVSNKEDELTNILKIASLYLKLKNNTLNDKFYNLLALTSSATEDFDVVTLESTFVKNAMLEVAARTYQNTFEGSLVTKGSTALEGNLGDSPLTSYILDKFFTSFLSKRFYVKEYQTPTHSETSPHLMNWDVDTTYVIGRGGSNHIASSFNGVKNHTIGSYYGERYGQNGTSSESFVYLWLASENRGNDFVYSAIIGSHLLGGYAEGDFLQRGENQTSKIDYVINGKGIIPRCNDMINCSPRLSIYYTPTNEVTREYSSLPRSQAQGSSSYVLINGKKLIPGKRILIDRNNEDIAIDIHLERHDKHVGASAPTQGQEQIEIIVENVLPKQSFNDNLPPWVLATIQPCRMNSPLPNGEISGQIGGGFPGSSSSNECTGSINDILSISMGGNSEYPLVLNYILNAVYNPHPQNSNIDAVILSALEQTRRKGADYRKDFYGTLGIIDNLLHDVTLNLQSDQRQYLVDMAMRISAWGYLYILPTLKEKIRLLRNSASFNFSGIDNAINQLCLAKELRSDEILKNARQTLEKTSQELNTEIPDQRNAVTTINKLLNEEANRADELDEAIEQLKRVKIELLLNQKNTLSKLDSLKTEVAQFENLTTQKQ